LVDIEVQLGVEALLARYVRTIDDDRLEEWPAMFTERCLYKVTTAENHAAGLPAGIIFCNSRGMLADRVQSLRQANIFEPQRYRHLISAVQVVKRDGGVAEVEADFLVVRTTQTGNTVLFAAGRYHDRILLAESPLFEQKVVVCDSTRTDTLLAIPL
jgi:3-phenylpropionate/cinnamic acid dioxygenase small subunit